MSRGGGDNPTLRMKFEADSTQPNKEIDKLEERARRGLTFGGESGLGGAAGMTGGPKPMSRIEDAAERAQIMADRSARGWGGSTATQPLLPFYAPQEQPGMPWATAASDPRRSGQGINIASWTSGVGPQPAAAPIAGHWTSAITSQPWIPYMPGPMGSSAWTTGIEQVTNPAVPWTSGLFPGNRTPGTLWGMASAAQMAAPFTNPWTTGLGAHQQPGASWATALQQLPPGPTNPWTTGIGTISTVPGAQFASAATYQQPVPPGASWASAAGMNQQQPGANWGSAAGVQQLENLTPGQVPWAFGTGAWGSAANTDAAGAAARWGSATNYRMPAPFVNPWATATGAGPVTPGAAWATAANMPPPPKNPWTTATGGGGGFGGSPPFGGWGTAAGATQFEEGPITGEAGTGLGGLLTRNLPFSHGQFIGTIFAAHEFERSFRAIQEGDFQAHLAPNQMESMQRQLHAIDVASSGMYGAVGAMALDAFGIGPSAARQALLPEIARTDLLNRRQDTIRELRFGDQAREARLSFNPVEIREVQLAEQRQAQKEKLGQEYGDLRTQLSNLPAAPQPFMTREDYRAEASELPIEAQQSQAYSEQKDPYAGFRTTLQAAISTKKAELDKLEKDSEADKSEVTRARFSFQTTEQARLTLAGAQLVEARGDPFTAAMKRFRAQRTVDYANRLPGAEHLVNFLIESATQQGALVSGFQRQIGFQSDDTRAATDIFNLQRSGHTFAAQRAGIEQETQQRLRELPNNFLFNTILGGNRLRGEIEQSRLSRLGEVGEEERRDLDIRHPARMQAYAFEVQGRSAEARIADIEGERDAFASGRDMTARENRQRVAEYNAQIEVIRAQDRREVNQIQLGLGTEQGILRAQLARNPMLAQTRAIEGEGQQRATSLFNQGRYDQGVESLQNTGLQLQLQRQNYIDAFHGIQVDPRMQAITYRPERNQEDPVKVLQSIKDAMDRIEKQVESLLED